MPARARSLRTLALFRNTAPDIAPSTMLRSESFCGKLVAKWNIASQVSSLPRSDSATNAAA